MGFKAESKDNDKKCIAQIGRRNLLIGAGLAAMALGARSAVAEGSSKKDRWDYEADVICVGSGAAGCAAAIAAVDKGAKVILLEKMPILGGTTARSGAIAWIPNHIFLRAKGIQDKKVDCLRYMARYSYPETYKPESPTLGLSESAYRLIEAFYDNGWKMVDRFQEIGAIQFSEMVPTPDYADHLPENVVSHGRELDGGLNEGGVKFIAQAERFLTEKGVDIFTDHRVTKVIISGGRAVGVEVENDEGVVRIKARQGIIFGTGGYVHNKALVELYQPPIYGASAPVSSTGDFIAIASEVGACMGSLHTAWRSQVMLEDALENRSIARTFFVPPGDSMILVNKNGHRVVNEKRNYNDRSLVHYVYDPVDNEYPNQLLFMIFDERTIDAFGNSLPFSVDRREMKYLIEGDSIDDLSEKIGSRLYGLKEKITDIKLSKYFSINLKNSIERFNGFARSGKDLDFYRGLHKYDKEWHKIFSAMRAGTSYPKNPMPNLTMHPFQESGPYYALILGPGALDTSGGPLVNERAEVIGHDKKPIPGLYGAGNCIASPSRAAYYGGGATIGLAMTYGYIAGLNAAADKEGVS